MWVNSKAANLVSLLDQEGTAPRDEAMLLKTLRLEKNFFSKASASQNFTIFSMASSLMGGTRGASVAKQKEKQRSAYILHLETMINICREHEKSG